MLQSLTTLSYFSYKGIQIIVAHEKAVFSLSIISLSNYVFLYYVHTISLLNVTQSIFSSRLITGIIEEGGK